MTSYAFLGAGALGGLYGGLLAKRGFEVHFLVRSDFEHLRSQGIRVDTPLGDFHLPAPNVYASAADMPQVDVAVVAWKTTSNEHLRPVLEKICGPESVVLVLQNGLDIERQAADIVGADRVLGGCCFLCSNKIAPGHIKHLDYGRIVFGEFGSEFAGTISDRMQAIAADFQAAGIDMQTANNLENVRWNKLAWNIPFNGLSVVLEANTYQIMHDEAASSLAKSLMEEVQRAAASCGQVIEDTALHRMLEDTRKMVPYDSSMSLDYRAKRPMEIEAIFGNPVRAAKRNGYTPAKIEMLYDQLRFIERGNLDLLNQSLK